MAKSYKTHSLKPFFLLISLSILSSSSARLLHDSFPQNLAASEPDFNLALPSDNVIDASPENPSEKDESRHVNVPCEMESNKNKDKNSDVKVGARLAGKYGPTLLNMLPKGSVPNSGPSKGSNDIND